MKVRTMAVAAALTLSSSLAIAQTTVVPAPTAPEGTVVVPDGARVVDPAGTIQNEKTTGMAPVVRPSTPGVVPGARYKARVGGEGVSDRAPGN